MDELDVVDELVLELLDHVELELQVDELDELVEVGDHVEELLWLVDVGVDIDEEVSPLPKFHEP